MTLTEMIDKIEKGLTIIFSRYGDGEWACILGKEGENCDGHEYFPDMSEQLARCVKRNNTYDVAIHGTSRLKEEMFQWMWENRMSMYFSRTEIFHNAFVGKDDATMEQFIDALKARKEEILLVGPKHLLAMEWDQIVIPEKNCWLESEKIMEQIDNWLPKKKIILFCAGMPACVWIDELYMKNGWTHSLIDVGSAFDPYCGVDSRSFHRKMRAKEEPKAIPKPNKKLAILIPTLRERHATFQRIANKLINQISALKLHDKIEVIKDVDSGETVIGEKRNRMIEKCVGKFEYVVFVDDDDDVSGNYVEQIYNATVVNPDCITFDAEVIVNEGQARPYVFSLGTTKYEYIDGAYLRPPGHLCAIRTEIAAQHKFGTQKRGSDVKWSETLAEEGVLKTEIRVTSAEPLYTYHRTLVQNAEV